MNKENSDLNPKGYQRLIPPRDLFIIEAGWVLSCDHHDRFKLLRDASVMIRGNTIEEVTEGRIKGSVPRITARDQLIVPGFINGHTHTCLGTATRGLIEAGRSYVRPTELVETLNDEELDDLTAFNLAEFLRSGCTTQLEMSASLRQAESYLRVAKKWGVRGFPNAMIPSVPRLYPIWHRRNDQVLHDSVNETLSEVEASLAFAKKHMGEADGRIMPMMTPHATDTHTPETMKAVLEAAKVLGTGIQMHLSQRVTEAATVKRLWGVTPIQWINQLGFFEVPLFGAHMVGIDLQIDPPIFANSDAVMVHCPTGGGPGFTSQPYPEALAAGMNVNVGTDTHSNDYIENIKLAVLYGKIRTRLLQNHSPVAMLAPTVEKAIEGATIVAAKGLRRDDLGRVRPGAKADLTSIDVTGFFVGTGALPPEPLSNLLYANGTAVRHVLTDGVFQVFNGQLLVDNEEEVLRRGGVVAEKLCEQLTIEGWFAQPDPSSREAREHLP